MAFDREKTLQVAQKYIEKRKYDRAILEYQKVVEHEPTDARTLLRIGDLQARLGAHAEAIATYDRVALYYAGRGFSLKAVAVLKQISELIDRHAPQLADQYGHVAPKLAQIYADLGLTNDALATYDAVARRLQNRGRDRDAVEIIRRMLALERSNPLPYLRLAEALCRVSRVDEAVEQFWSAAQLLTQQGRPDDALKVLERILHFRQDARVARVAADLYLTKNTREAGLSALSRLQLCFEADPRDLDTLALLARAFDVIGQPAKGVEVYKEMVRIAGETGQRELHQRYVQHLLAVAPGDDQVRALARVYRLDPAQRSGSLGPGSPGPGSPGPGSPGPGSLGPGSPGAGSLRPGAGGAGHSSSPPESLTEDDLEFIEDEEVALPPPVQVVRPAPAPAAMEVARAAGRDNTALGNAAPGNAAPGYAAQGNAARHDARRDTAGRDLSVSSQPAADTVADPRKALVDAEAFRALRMFAKAAATLKKALAGAPHSLELRAALQQVLLDMGDRDGAIDQMLSVAQHYVDRGSTSAAEAELYQVLELAPEHPAAVALLDRIEALAKGRRKAGRSAPKASPGAHGRDERSSPTGEHEAFELVAARASTSPGAEPSDPELEPELEADDGPLPAYELEDDDLISVMPAVAPAPGPAAPVAAPPAGAPVGKAPAAAAVVKASAASPVAKPPADSPLPRFSLDSGLDSGLHAAPKAPAARGTAARGPGAAGGQPSRAPERRSEPMASQPAPSQRESIRAALDEAQFFSSRGLYQDASLILLDRLEQYPDDPELKQALDDIEPKLDSESGTRDVGRLTEDAAAAHAPAHGFDDEEDTTASSPLPDELTARIADARKGKGPELGVQFSTDGATKAGPVIDADAELDLVQALDEPKQEQIDVDEVFAKFKQGVKAQVSDNDSATHYDLGVAYKEMGLVVDAIREFEVASRDPKRECNCLAMIGMMHRDRGDLDRAAEAYVRGLSAQHKTVSQEVSLYYDLGLIYEMKNDADEAIYYFQRITRRDPTYRDVSQRLAALLPRSRRFSQPARAINDDNDFERSFDDLYKPE